MTILSFELTMPNVGSWNGKWTGADKKYYVIKKFSDRFFESDLKKLLNGKPSANFYYNFGDGWGANITMEPVTAKEASKRKKNSKGFYGYEWMVESIIMCGEIKTAQQRKEMINKTPSLTV